MANVFEANIFDDSKDLEYLARLERALNGLDADGKKVGDGLQKSFNQANKAGQQVADTFDEIGRSAKREVDGIEAARRKYKELEAAAKTLKEALRNATDPRAINNYSKALAEARAGMRQLEQGAKTAGVNLRGAGTAGSGAANLIKGAFAAVSLLTLVQQVGQLTVGAVRLAAEYEKVKASFTAFLGSAKAADGVLRDLANFAARTPLDTGEVQQAGKALLGFGESAKNLVPVLERIGNIAAGTGKDFNELTLIYGKARTAGVLYAEDLNQLIEAGVPIIQELSKNLGISTAEVKKFASEGLITFKDLEVAFFNLSTSSGKFAGQMEAQAQTLSGKWDIFLSKIKDIGREFGERLTPFLKSTLDTVSRDLDQVMDDFANGFDRINDPAAFAARTKKTRDAQREANELANREEETLQRKFYDESQRRVDEIQKAANAKRLKEQERANKEAAALDKQRAQLMIDAMKEGEEKELAVERLRFQTLAAELRKFGLSTREAEEQHRMNLLEIQTKYHVERLNKAQDALDAERKAVEEGLKELEKAEIEGREELAKARDDARKKFDKAAGEGDAFQSALFEQAELELKAVFYSRRRNESEIQKFDEAAAKRREIFQLNLQRTELERALLFGSELSSTERATLEQRIKNISTAIEQITQGTGEGRQGEPMTFFDLLGIDLGDDEGAVTEAVARSIQAIQQLTDAAVEAAERRTEARQKEVDDLESQLAKEVELQKKGEANNSDLLRAQLAERKRQRDLALQEESKAKRSQVLLDSAQQASSLVTASANIFKSLSSIPFVGIPLAITTIALMFGAFIKAKSDALKSIPKLRKGEGPGERIKGPSHERGGVLRELEGDEWVIGTKHSREHDGFLGRLNKGEYTGRDLDRELSKPRRNPVSEAVPRIKHLEGMGRVSESEREYKMLVRAFREANGDVVRAIDEKPVVMPMPDGYIREEKRGSTTDRKYVKVAR
jgi:tape measure domain-containing protein